MVLARFFSAAFLGLDGCPIEIEIDAKKSEKEHLILVGLPDTAVKESKDRVLSALGNSGYSFQGMQCTINLAPADVKKEGSFYDLPIALGLLLSLGKIQTSVSDDYLCVGELSLSGETRPIRGAIAMALLARSLNKKGIILPLANAEEANAVPEISIIGVKTLKEAVAFFEKPQIRKIENTIPSPDPITPLIDLREIKGQALGKRALEIAASGTHHLLFFGPPGNGKTLLAKALSGLLPPLSIDEALEVTKIHSVAGILGKNSLIRHSPFRAPHHTISSVALIGGGSIPRPGEISLAHRGILFLDELPEFPRHVLETLRQPLENGYAHISRAGGRFAFPCRCLLIAAMNPCPCGFLGHPQKSCRDTSLQIQKYRSKLSGPLLDRIDMHVEIPVLTPDELRNDSFSDSSFEVRERVKKARVRQMNRRGKLNSELTPSEIEKDCLLDHPSELLFRQAIAQMGLSPRSVHRILKVARTIADLSDAEKIETEHLMEAIQFKAI